MGERENGRVGEEALPGSGTGEGKKRIRPWLGLSLVALVLLAFVLRAWGLTWGLPHAGRYYPYHPDEPTLLAVVCRVNPLWGVVTTGFYNYGTLYIFLSRLAYDFTAPFAGWGSVPRDAPFSTWVGDFARLLWLSRGVAVFLGAATVLLTYWLGRTLFSTRTGWLGAFFLAVAPLPVMLSHYMAVDTPATFFTTLALLFAARALRAGSPRGAVGYLVAAGFASGLAAGTKYNMVVALLAAAVPIWTMARSGSKRAGAAVLGAAGAVLACGIAFIIATPGAVLQTGKFVEDVLYETERNRTGQGLVYIATPPAALYHLGISLPVALEWPLYLLCSAGFAWSLWRRRPEDWLLLLFVVFSFLPLVPAERKYLRYVGPLIPPLVLFAARLVDEMLAKGDPALEGGVSPRRRRASGGFWKTWAGAAAGAAIASTVAHLGVIAGPDARDQAAAYLFEHAARSDIVALGADPWYYTPPIDPTTACVKWAAYGGPPRWDVPNERGARLPVCQLDRFRVVAPASTPPWGPAGALPVARLREFHPKFVVLTDYEYEDPERLRRADPKFQNGVLDLMAELGREGYRGRNSTTR